MRNQYDYFLALSGEVAQIHEGVSELQRFYLQERQKIGDTTNPFITDEMKRKEEKRKKQLKLLQGTFEQKKLKINPFRDSSDLWALLCSSSRDYCSNSATTATVTAAAAATTTKSRSSGRNGNHRHFWLCHARHHFHLWCSSHWSQ